ncbi:MAG: hypothetical protein Q4E06_02445 [Lautropia sp.]|nr:hypothetical protein [Lautropia sp.]
MQPALLLTLIDMTAINTSSPAPIVLVGHSLAVLVAATERAYRGLRTTIINPGGPLGGRFAGVQAIGRCHEAGLQLYDFGAPDTAALPRVDSYEPMRFDDVARFGGIVRRYVLSHQHTRPISAPRMWLGGKLLPDMLLGQQPGAIRHLPQSAAIHRELAIVERAVRAESRLWHPANRTAWPEEGSAPADWKFTTGNLVFDYDTLSQQLHGRCLHDTLFAPYARQLMHEDVGLLAVRHHARAGLPLYAPDSLLAALSGSPDASGEGARHSYPDGSSIVALCQQLVNVVRHTPTIRVLDDTVLRVRRDAQGFCLHTRQHGEIRCERLGWAQPVAQGLVAAGGPGLPEQSRYLPTMLGFIRLHADNLSDNFSVVQAASADVGLYRVTSRTGCGAPTDAGMVELMVEAHPARFAEHHGPLSDSTAQMRAMLGDLVTMGLVRPQAQPAAFEVLHQAEGRVLPTPAALAMHAEAHARLEAALPGIELLGEAAGLFADSLSDQIVQGLKAAQQPRSRSEGEAIPFVARYRDTEMAAA